MGESRREKSTRNKELTLMGLFGSDALENLEKRLGEATDFSFSIIDYKGRKVVKDYNQEAYGHYVRKEGEDSSCQMEQAFAAARSAITNQPYIYLCHCGLVKVAVPIVLKDQYLGAVICGYVRCYDVDEVDSFTKQPVIQKENPVEKEIIPEEYMMEIPVYHARKIQSIANLVFYILQELCLKERYSLKCLGQEHNQIHMEDMRQRNKELKEKVKSLEEIALRSNMFPQTLLNMLVTLSSAAIVEDASMTQDMITSFSSILRYYVEYHKTYITLGQELEQIALYFKVLKIRYEKRLDFEMHWPEEVKEQRIPKLILLPLVEYMVNFGVLNQSFKGTFHSSVEFISDRCVITFSLEHLGEEEGAMAYRRESGNVINDKALNEQMTDLEKRFRFEYGDDYTLKIETDLVIIDIPKQ